MLIITLHFFFYDYESSRTARTVLKVGSGMYVPRFESRQEQEISSSPKRPDRPWGPPSVLHNDYWAPSPEIKRRGVRLTIYIHLVPGLRMCRAKPPLPYIPLWCVHGLHVITFTTTTFHGFS